MDPTSIVPWIVNGGVALLVLGLMLTKQLIPGWLYSEKKEEIAELKIALEHERERSDTAVSAASATRDILLSLRGRYGDVEDSRAKAP